MGSVLTARKKFSHLIMSWMTVIQAIAKNLNHLLNTRALRQSIRSRNPNLHLIGFNEQFKIIPFPIQQKYFEFGSWCDEDVFTKYLKITLPIILWYAYWN